MGSTDIPFADWPRFIEAASQALVGVEVSMEIHADVTRTDEWLVLQGLSFEIGTDTLWIHTDRMEHEVVRPRALRAVEQGERLEALEIDADDARIVLRFRVPTLSR